jgi:hypothetical protein
MVGGQEAQVGRIKGATPPRAGLAVHLPERKERAVLGIPLIERAGPSQGQEIGPQFVVSAARFGTHVRDLAALVQTRQPVARAT